MPNTAPPARRALRGMLSLFTWMAMTAAVMAGLPGMAQARETKAEAVELGDDFQAAARAPQWVSVSDMAALKGLRRVAVPQFTVEFVISDSVSAETSGFAAAGRASTTGYYKLVGVAEADFQKLAEQAYADLVSQLQASGLQVVPASEVQGAPTWRKLAADGAPLPSRSDSAVTVAPPGMALYGLNRAQAATAKPGLFGALSAIGAGFGAAGASMDNVTLQKELGDAALLEVAIRLHFAQLSSNTNGFFSRLGNTAEVSAKLHAVVDSASLTLQSGSQISVLRLKQPLLLDPSAFTEMRKEATTGADVAGAVAVGLLRLATGSSDSSSYDKYEAVADSARYSNVVGKGLGSVNALFITRMQSGR
jgi:hypothetical protein